MIRSSAYPLATKTGISNCNFLISSTTAFPPIPHGTVGSKKLKEHKTCTCFAELPEVLLIEPAQTESTFNVISGAISTNDINLKDGINFVIMKCSFIPKTLSHYNRIFSLTLLLCILGYYLHRFTKILKTGSNTPPLQYVIIYTLCREKNMKAQGTCSVAKWDEKDFSLLPDEMKITKADIEYTINGDIEGKAVVQYVMFYSRHNKSDPHDSSAKYVGLIQFSGNVSGKSGSFVLEDNGTFKSGSADSKIKIINNSGTADLKNIQGHGIYRANKDGFHFELDYTL